MGTSLSSPPLKLVFMVWLMVHLLLSLCQVCVATGNYSSAIVCKKPEGEALLKLRDGFVSNNVSQHFPAWDGEDCCRWRGVHCDNNTGYVIQLNLQQKLEDPRERDDEGAGGLNASQVLSPLLELKRLTHLNLRGSNFYRSSMPKFMGSLKQLRYLDLSLTSFGGLVPPELGNLTKLEVLDLSDFMVPRKEMRVTRFDWVWGLLRLQSLKMNNLDLSEAQDSMQVFYRLPNLSKLHLRNCGLHSFQFPSDYSNTSTNHSNLQYLDLSQNEFKGSLPPIFGNLDALQSLNLSNNEFNGLIPRSFGNLKILEHMDLSFNDFTQAEGGIWGIVGNPCQIKYLDLSNNGIAQELVNPPVNFSKCTTYDLEVLSLAFNDFSGNITTLKLQQFIKLQVLDLEGNNMHGTLGEGDIGNLSKLSHLDIIFNLLVVVNLTSDWTPPFLLRVLRLDYCRIINPPRWLSSQSKLEVLNLPKTGISGDLQDWLWNLTSLIVLDLSTNFLTGPLPKQLNHNLWYFDIGHNNISGPIPDLFGQNCSLDVLLLNNNFLEGNIPSSLRYCTGLQELDLSSNRLVGDIPPWTIGNLRNLVILALNNNQFGPHKGSSVLSDDTIGSIPNALCNFTSLMTLDLQENMLSGKIPDCWSTNSSLHSINLSANKLSGVIPLSILNTGVRLLHLNDNMLSGHIPSYSNGFRHLRLFDVGGNKLDGEIPKWLNNRTNSTLEVLRLQGNMFNGTIPHHLCSLPLLRVMDLARNQFTGNVPLCLGNLIGMNLPRGQIWMNDAIDYIVPGVLHEDYGRVDNGADENVDGILRPYTSTLIYLTSIDLSSNYLVGPIPVELTKLFGLIVLNLSHNHLTGDIPQSIGDMISLEMLDLSMNSLCGGIPPSIGNIDSMNYLNLSYNNLSGEIPTDGHLETLAEPSRYAGNPLLCGELLPKCSTHEDPPKSPGNDAEDDEDKHEKMWFCLVVMAGLSTGFWVVVGTLLVKKRWRHGLFRHVEDASDWLYVAVALKKAKLKRTFKRDN